MDTEQLCMVSGEPAHLYMGFYGGCTLAYLIYFLLPFVFKIKNYILQVKMKNNPHNI
jgi:hypothetical protein